MGKAKNFVKEETIKRIKNLLNKYSKEEMLKSDEFNSLTTHYINAFERKHLDTIIELCCDNKSYDEIRLIVQHNESNNKTTLNNEEMDPVEKAVSVFMVNDQKVIEVEPVEVVIGNDNSEEQKTATNKVVKSETSVNEENKKSESQKTATNKVVKSDTVDKKKSSNNTNESKTLEEAFSDFYSDFDKMIERVANKTGHNKKKKPA